MYRELMISQIYSNLQGKQVLAYISTREHCGKSCFWIISLTVSLQIYFSYWRLDIMALRQVSGVGFRQTEGIRYLKVMIPELSVVIIASVNILTKIHTSLKIPYLSFRKLIHVWVADTLAPLLARYNAISDYSGHTSKPVSQTPQICLHFPFSPTQIRTCNLNMQSDPCRSNPPRLDHLTSENIQLFLYLHSQQTSKETHQANKI